MKAKILIMSVKSGKVLEPQIGRYISVPHAKQLISEPFDGNPIEMRESIQNVGSTYEVVDPQDYELLFKFVFAKVAGIAKTKHIIGSRPESIRRQLQRLSSAQSIHKQTKSE